MVEQGTDYNAVDVKILKKIKYAIECENTNNKTYEKNLKFFYRGGMDPDDSAALEYDEKTQLSFNMLPPIVNQNSKQISDSSPTTRVKAFDEDDPKLVSAADNINDKLYELFDKSNYTVKITEAAIKAMVGGKAVFKMKTKYQSSRSFEQKVVLEYLPDPTKIFFDPKSKLPSRSDSMYVIHQVELTEEELKEQFPNATLSAHAVTRCSYRCRTGGKGDYCYSICDYYYYDVEGETLYLLSDLETKEEQILSTSDLKKNGDKIKVQGEIAQVTDQLGTITTYTLIDSRKITKKSVRCKRILGNQELEDEAINFDCMPFSQLTGKQWLEDNKMQIAPFIDDAIDAQRAKNMMGNEFLSEALSLQKQTYAISEEQLTDMTLEFMRDPNTKNILIYKAFIKGPDGKHTLMPPPTITALTRVPPEYIQMFTALDNTIQSILGAYQFSLNQKDLSGKALYAIAQYVSGMLTPFVNNLLDMLESITMCALSCFRYIYSDSQYDFNYEVDQFEIGITAGINNKLQQEANIERLIDLAKNDPSSLFAQFLSSPEGTLLLLKNMDLNDKEKITKQFEQFAQSKEQAKPPPSPDDIKAQAALLTAKTGAASAQSNSQEEQAKIGLKGRELEAKITTENNKILTELHKTQVTKQSGAVDNLIEAARIEAENLKTLKQEY